MPTYQVFLIFFFKEMTSRDLLLPHPVLLSDFFIGSTDEASPDCAWMIRHLSDQENGNERSSIWAAAPFKTLGGSLKKKRPSCEELNPFMKKAAFYSMWQLHRVQELFSMGEGIKLPSSVFQPLLEL